LRTAPSPARQPRLRQRFAQSRTCRTALALMTRRGRLTRERRARPNADDGRVPNAEDLRGAGDFGASPDAEVAATEDRRWSARLASRPHGAGSRLALAAAVAADQRRLDVFRRRTAA
jgi:hypothetical protein